MDSILRKIERTDGCWNWKGDTSKGYGKVRIKGKNYRAHRLVYELLVGKIPEGLELDHLCRNRACVNPKHLEPVTHSENIRRSLPFKKLRTFCRNGHELTGSNLAKSYAYSGRICRICKNKNQIEYMKRKKANHSL